MMSGLVCGVIVFCWMRFVCLFVLFVCCRVVLIVLSFKFLLFYVEVFWFSAWLICVV